LTDFSAIHAPVAGVALPNLAPVPVVLEAVLWPWRPVEVSISENARLAELEMQAKREKKAAWRFVKGRGDGA
jgi:hypothetical protein